MIPSVCIIKQFCIQGELIPLPGQVKNVMMFKMIGLLKRHMPGGLFTAVRHPNEQDVLFSWRLVNETIVFND